MKRVYEERHFSQQKYLKLKSDLSKLYRVPFMEDNEELVSQPPGMTRALFSYQLRAIAKMQKIERAPTIKVGKLEMKPRGGVLCEAVGMGKTAEIIGLCMLDSTRPGNNLVLCPQHLSRQWVSEIKKFAPSLKTGLLDGSDGSHSAFDRSQIFAADIFVITLETFLDTFAFLRNLSFNRIILDECHDAVALGSGTTNKIASIRCKHMWCVTATPFPLVDQSVYGINQLLGIKVRLIISDSPFTNSKTILPANHPFEVLKREIYVKNNPLSPRLGGEGHDRIMEPFVIRKFSVKFSDIEWAFYRQEARGISSTNLFSEKYESLRKLCCHPACSSRWMNRLLAERSGDAGVSGSSTQYAPLSLDQLRARMVTWSTQDKVEIEKRLAKTQDRIIGAVNGLYLGIEFHREVKLSRSGHAELLDDMVKSEHMASADLHHFISQALGGQSVITLGVALCEDYIKEKYDSSKKVYMRGREAISYAEGSEEIKDYSTKELISFLLFTLRSLDVARKRLCEQQLAINELAKQSEYFDAMIPLEDVEERMCTPVPSPSSSLSPTAASSSLPGIDSTGAGDMYELTTFTIPAAGGQEVVDNKRTERVSDSAMSTDLLSKGDGAVLAATRKKVFNCYICAENVFLVGVTPCGHAACFNCMTQWVKRKLHCPNCRARTDPASIQSVDTRIRDKPSVENTPSGSSEEEEVNADAVAKYGSKPAAILHYVNKILNKDNSTKILVFSSYRESLMVMSETLQAAGVNSMTCGLSAESNDIQEAIESFQNNSSHRVLMMRSTTLAAGTNLQIANHVIFLEPAGINLSDALAIETQAVGRTCRIGQGKQVEVVYFIMHDSIESKLYELLSNGRAAANVLQGSEGGCAESYGDFIDNDQNAPFHGSQLSPYGISRGEGGDTIHISYAREVHEVEHIVPVVSIDSDGDGPNHCTPMSSEEPRRRTMRRQRSSGSSCTTTATGEIIDLTGDD